MELFRNREVVRLAQAMAAVFIVGVALSYSISPAAVAVVVAASVGFVLLFGVFTWWRYRALARLSGYLAQVRRGDYSLDVRDNVEGELSVLKNEIYKVTVTLKEQAAAQEKKKAYLAQALSDISHQLKTPLTSMFVLTDLLCGENLPPEKRAEFTQRMRAQLERMQWLVTSLLKLSRLDAGTVEFKPRKADANQLLQAACQPLLIPMELKGQRLETCAGEDVRIHCDANWTAEALINIIKNCVEHTPQGGVIRVTASDNPLYAEIVISDNGCGIDPADLPYIFNRFYRGRNAAEDSLGIGLAMARSIVTAQGGSIEVKSDRGGTKFFVRFPK